ncbi:hypothetical protein DPMN_073134 [Dreissena polymorpha]|uniref:Uncharacterized protein n=1 Tax=Dreissena polymorpha TaxID=45954 RepID=A0A9D4BYL8_DREPO|nr:hypothetical protein DPMN_073134 [Dreissena polymorpha]
MSTGSDFTGPPLARSLTGLLGLSVRWAVVSRAGVPQVVSSDMVHASRRASLRWHARGLPLWFPDTIRAGPLPGIVRGDGGSWDSWAGGLQGSPVVCCCCRSFSISCFMVML